MVGPEPEPEQPPFQLLSDTARGRALEATVQLCAGAEVFRSAPDVSVVYTDHTSAVCASCFQQAEMLAGCAGCARFSLCPRCDSGALRRWHEADECPAFLRIPAGMRGGDTDYLRFILRYFAILRHGAPPIPDGVAVPAGDFAARGFLELCDNLDKQTEEFKDWSAEFAGLFAQHVDLPAGVTAAELAVLLAKIRANALGFPFSADGAVTLGWCLHSVAAAFNHSCRPNVCIVGDRDVVVNQVLGRFDVDSALRRY